MDLANVGIYRITCTINGRVYFGSSNNLKKRLKEHRWSLDSHQHRNSYLQSDWDLYGPTAFEFRVLIRRTLSKQALLELENLFLHNYWDGQVRCYNVAFDARAARRGCVVSKATRTRMSEAQKRRPPTTVETRSKMAESCRGRKFSEATRLKLSTAAKNRAPITEETRAKMSKASKGREVSEETLIKRSQALKGRKVSAETRVKISVAKMGHEVSAETRAKISKTKVARRPLTGAER